MSITPTRVMANIYHALSSDILDLVSDEEGLDKALEYSRDTSEPIILWDHKGWWKVYPDGTVENSDG